MITSFSPYLHFNGDCEEALRFYAELLGGKIEYISRYSEGVLAGKIMHAHLSLPGGWAISAGDNDKPYTHGDALDLHVQIDTAENGRKVFSRLAEGGEVLNEMLPNPPPDDGGMSGMLVDRYGVRWIVTSPV